MNIRITKKLAVKTRFSGSIDQQVREWEALTDYCKSHARTMRAAAQKTLNYMPDPPKPQKTNR